MKIAVTSQNRKSITKHAGRCRKLWVFITENNNIGDKKLLEFPKELAFQESSPHESQPLDDIDLLVAGDMGQGLVKRLELKGIQGFITKESNPEKAVLLFLSGSLESEQPKHHHGHNK